MQLAFALVTKGKHGPSALGGLEPVATVPYLVTSKLLRNPTRQTDPFRTVYNGALGQWLHCASLGFDHYVLCRCVKARTEYSLSYEVSPDAPSPKPPLEYNRHSYRSLAAGIAMITPITKIIERAHIDRDESDTAYFDALMYAGEMTVKLVAAGLVAAVQDDRDRHRYRLEHTLVRADSLGHWTQAIDDILIGPTSQFLDPKAWPTQRELTKGMPTKSWQAICIQELTVSLDCVNVQSLTPAGNVQGRDWFKKFVELRNRTRGHGAPPPSTRSQAAPSLERSIVTLAENLSLFMLPWAYLYRNLSGKYRVTTWNELDEKFAELKRSTAYSFTNGVYVNFDEPRIVKLVESDPEGSDYWFANGGFNNTHYEMLSYLSDDRLFPPSSPYMLPVEQLPPSETEGLGYLNSKGKTFTNLPEPPSKYVARPELEEELYSQLTELDRHFLVTLTGRGGIGKTSTALHVLSTLMESDTCPYEVVVWFSARDVDLMQSGPKAVQPQGVSASDFAVEYAGLLNPGERHIKGFDPRDYLARQLAGETVGPTLFVFDNFETTTSPVEVFQWLDTYVRGPNKVLITSRDRGFTGDYVVQVPGMTQSEAEELIIRTCESLGIRDSMTADYMDRLITESDGHPYIIKLLLGELARSSSQHPERIMAGQSEALVALFERSYNRLSPAAQRVFLTLCRWRSSVPALALEAVLLRPVNERIDVQAALEELVRSSFVEEVIDDTSGEPEVVVPLAARLFGMRKLEVSVWKASIETDTAMLQLLGARMSGSSIELRQRITRLFRNVAYGLSRGTVEFPEIEPVLEYITSRYSPASLLLADLAAELGLGGAKEERHLLHYVEHRESHEESLLEVWKRIADIRRDLGDVKGELHALAEICALRDTPTNVVSNSANRINGILRMMPPGQLSREEKQFILTDVVNAFQSRASQQMGFDATDLSRLAWLQVHLDDTATALETVHSGLRIEPNNPHCKRLEARLTGRPLG